MQDIYIYKNPNSQLKASYIVKTTNEPTISKEFILTTKPKLISIRTRGGLPVSSTGETIRVTVNTNCILRKSNVGSPTIFNEPVFVIFIPNDSPHYESIKHIFDDANLSVTIPSGLDTYWPNPKLSFKTTQTDQVAKGLILYYDFTADGFEAGTDPVPTEFSEIEVDITNIKIPANESFTDSRNITFYIGSYDESSGGCKMVIRQDKLSELEIVSVADEFNKYSHASVVDDTFKPTIGVFSKDVFTVESLITE